MRRITILNIVHRSILVSSAVEDSARLASLNALSSLFFLSGPSMVPFPLPLSLLDDL